MPYRPRIEINLRPALVNPKQYELFHLIWKELKSIVNM